MVDFKYKHITRNARKLLVVFNDMTQVGFSDHFSLYKQLDRIFADYDILFIKDIAEYYWYLTIIDSIYSLLTTLAPSYEDGIYGFAGSSGSIGLLNILPHLPNFKAAVVINGQVSLRKSHVDLYRNCRDCYIFTEEKISTSYNRDYLEPLLRINEVCCGKIRFYHNQSMSDSAHHRILREFIKDHPYHPTAFEAIFEETRDAPSHGNYLVKKYRDSYLLEYKAFFDAFSK